MGIRGLHNFSKLLENPLSLNLRNSVSPISKIKEVIRSELYNQRKLQTLTNNFLIFTILIANKPFPSREGAIINQHLIWQFMIYANPLLICRNFFTSSSIKILQPYLGILMKVFSILSFKKYHVCLNNIKQSVKGRLKG